MEPDTTWLSSPFLNKQRVTWRGTMETESSNTRQGVERRKSNSGWMLASKHASKGQGCHRWVRYQILWGSQTVTPDQLRVRSPMRGSQYQMHRTGTHCWELPSPLPSSHKGWKPSNKELFNRPSLVMDQLWHLARSPLAPEKWQSLQMPRGLSSASFLVTVCLQEASLLEQVLSLFLPIQIGFMPLFFKKNCFKPTL